MRSSTVFPEPPPLRALYSVMSEDLLGNPVFEEKAWEHPPSVALGNEVPSWD